MTVPAWPSALPRPNRPGWQSQLGDPRLAKAADTGPPGYRRRWSSVARNVSLVIDVSRSERAVFDTFFEQTTDFGSLPFTMSDATTDGWPLLAGDGSPVLDGAGAPILLSAEWLCLFGEDMPTTTIKGVRFVISFSVVVMP
jgi:hypothetical protein